MNRKHGPSFPTLVAVSNERRQRWLLVAAAGFLSMLILLLFTVFYSPREVASNGAVNSLPINSIGSVLVWTFEGPVRAGAQLSNVRMRQMLWPRNNVPETAILDVAEVRSLYALYDLPPNTPVLRNQLTGDPWGVRIPLDDGMRALPVEASAVEDSEGMATPGTRVDIVYSRQVNGEMVSDVIVHNSLIVSCGGETRIPRMPLPQAQRLRCKTLTLQVTPRDALKVITAKKLGSLSLIIRPTNDFKEGPKETVTGSGLNDSQPRPTPGPKCSIGHARSIGQQWEVGCDGTLSNVIQNEP